VFADKYRVDRIIGEGGMGIVVAAHHLELDQKVAVKFLLDDLTTSAEGEERFRREARAAAKIQSDHVVRVLDVGVLPTGERYMVMEYMEGRDLSEELAEKHAFPAGVAAAFVLEAIDAVGQAHSVGIVHRDLKPANLFLARRGDGSQRIKVLDFGISKSIGLATSNEMSLTKTSAWIGSPLYMAPEQMQSARDVDHRADIWSLGAILYELIAGRPPYVAESLPQLCNLLITTDPEPIQNVVPSIPEGLASAIMNCLIRDREQRTQSTGELARVLVNYATSITGSGLRKSLFDQTELHGRPSDLGLSASSVPAVTATNPTTAAWGATNNERRRPGGKLGWAVAALIVAGAGAFFVLRGSAGEHSMEESPAIGVAPSGVPAEPAQKPSPVREELVPVPAPEPEPEPAEKPAEGASAPAVTPSPQPKQVQKQAPAPRPAPPPAPKKEDDFADFGGRR